jgi:hypothetical protein
MFKILFHREIREIWEESGDFGGMAFDWVGLRSRADTRETRARKNKPMGGLFGRLVFRALVSREPPLAASRTPSLISPISL